MSYPQDVDKNNDLQFATPWRRFLPFIVGGVGVVLIGAGIFVNMWKQQESESVETSEDVSPQATEFVKGVNNVKIIKVDISGAVIKPGLVEIPADSRVQDVLISAGGIDAKADRNYISRSINLAQPVQDGMKIYIPFEGESVSANTESGGGAGGQSSSFNINSASQAKLEELPGVGPVTAKKIIDGRPYGDVSELSTKKVVSKAVFDKIKDQVATY